MASSVAQYIPQSPSPHSPPQTPSPSPKPLDPITTKAIPPVVSLDTPITTPEATLPEPPTLLSTTSSTRASSTATRTKSSGQTGMGINFPAEANPLPAELSEVIGGADMARSASDPSKSFMPASASMGPSRSATGMREYRLPRQGETSEISYDNLQPGFAASRPRAHSPSPIKNSETNGFASSSSFHTNSLGTEHRERIVSPTKANFEAGATMPKPLEINGVSDNNGLLSVDQNSPIWSPAIDGKKEPSIRPPPPGYETHDPSLYIHPSGKSRARSPFTAALSPGEGNFPLTKAEYEPHLLPGQAYNQTTTKEGGAKESFRDSAVYWLSLYFFFNLGLTLFNKIVLVSFPFPYTLTGLHALSGCAGTYFALERGAFVPARLTQKENLILAAFSVLYTINIAVSNISLQLVTVPFHQVVRASTPLFTILISTIVLRTRFSMMKLVSLLPVVAGVGFATYGDYYFTAWGLILTLLGTFLAALKTVVTNLIQTGGGQRLKLHPLDLLMRMSPLAFVQCVIYGWYTGELERVRQYGATQMTRSKAIALLVNGVIACGLNIVSFTANKKAGALTMTVSANCKQVLTIALAVVLFDLHISPTNGIGILLTLIGGGWYGYVEYTEKSKKNVKVVG